MCVEGATYRVITCARSRQALVVGFGSVFTCAFSSIRRTGTISTARTAAQISSAIEQLREAIRQREQRCVEAMLKLYGFRTSDAAASDLPLLDGRWG